jgi:hypothetical protein
MIGILIASIVAATSLAVLAVCAVVALLKKSS